MVIFLVLITFVLFISIELLLSYRRKRKAVEADSPAAISEKSPVDTVSEILAPEDEPEGVYYNPGHLWAFREMDGSVKIGLDNFFHRVVGKIDKIEVPQPGEDIAEATNLIKVKSGDREVTVSVPVRGKVKEVNIGAVENPGYLSKRKYSDRWLFSIEPDNFQETMPLFKAGTEAKNWMSNEIKRVKDLISGFMSTGDLKLQTMADGGTIVKGVSEMLDNQSWEKLKKEFFETEAFK